MSRPESAILESAPEFGIHTGLVDGARRPRRLSAETRRLASRYLAGEFGATMREAAFGLDPATVAGMSPNQHYAAACRIIAEQAPLRMLSEERLAGAATLLEAARHRMPASPFASTSHTTLGFERVLKSGYRGLRQRLDERLSRGNLDEKGRDFLSACRQCLDAAGAWHLRHVQCLEERVAGSDGLALKREAAVLGSLRPVPENPPTSFREAVQSLWLMWSFQRLCGNWSGIGRLDKMLGPWLEKDLAAGRITMDEARELLAHFWIKGCEWIRPPSEANRGSGDAQFYQNIVLGGVDEKGDSVVNDVTYLVLDIVEELHISDFPIAVRVNASTPERLWRRIADVQRLGGGIVAIYNEDVILRALTRFGYPMEEARDFANDGCWEIMLPGKTAFGYVPFDMLKVLQETIGLGPENRTTPDFASYEALYAAFLDELAGERGLARIHRDIDATYLWNLPAPLVSLFVDDCIERARSYYNRGARYSVRAPHAGGLPDTANSLLVLQKLVYEEKAFTLREFTEILRRDWQDQEPLRRRIQSRFELYGNDSAEADAVTCRLYDDYVAIGSRVHERNGVLRPLGISTFGREIAFREHRVATAFGRRKGDVLATNLAPTPGTDLRGPTAVIQSFCKMDFEKLPNGAPLELKILPSSIQGETGRAALVGLLQSFVQLGGLFLHIDVVDSALLRDAQLHPDRYPNLSVRISGWSARFATLDRTWQDMIIQRTEQAL